MRNVGIRNVKKTVNDNCIGGYKMGTKLKEGLVISSPYLPNGEWIVVSVWEQEPMLTVGNRTSSYENKFNLIKLDEDGKYNENNEKVTISTCYVYRDSICEDDIEIIRSMKKSFT